MKSILFCCQILVFSSSVFVHGQDSSFVQPAIESIFMQFDNVRDFTLSNSEDEAYFTGQSALGEVSVIFRIERKNGDWQKPEIASFSGTHHDLEPFLSPDNLRLYFVSNRLVYDTSTTKNYDIWYVERPSLKKPWSNPVNMGAPVNTSYDEFYPSVARNGNIYFTSVRPGRGDKDDIYVSYFTDNGYADPVLLSDAINTDGYEYNAYIAADESYILFGGYNRQDGLGSGDIYLSKNINGTWKKAINLGEKVNSKWMDYCPFILHDTLYFTSKRVKTKMGSFSFKSVDDFLTQMNDYSNGQSRIYKIKLEGEILN